MDMLYFSSETLICLGVEAALMILLPVPLLIVWKKKTRLSMKIFITGAVTFFLFAIVLKVLPAMLLFNGDNAVAKAIRNNPLLFYLTGGLLAGIFEETGRFIAFKTILKRDTQKQTAIAYGIGHGGFECMYIGFNVITIIAMGMIINQNGIESVTGQLSSEQLEAVIQQLKDYTAADILTVFLAVLERVSAVMIHIAFSILVFHGVHHKSSWYLFPAAVLMHALFDFSLVIRTYGVPDIILELILLVSALTIFFLSCRFVYVKSENNKA